MEAMTTDANVQLVRDLTKEVYTDHKLDAATKYYADDAVFIRSGSEPRDLEEMLAGLREFFAAFPDIGGDVADVVAQDDKVAYRFVATGTHDGKYQGIESTGAEIEIEGVNFCRIRDGKIVEVWSLSDQFGLRQQLDASTGE